jgi:hypothetical protein
MTYINFFLLQPYKGSNAYSSLLVKQNPELGVLIPDDPPSSNLLPEIFSEPYQIEKFVINYVAIGVSSGSATLQLWPCKYKSREIFHFKQF